MIPTEQLNEVSAIPLAGDPAGFEVVGLGDSFEESVQPPFSVNAYSGERGRIYSQVFVKIPEPGQIYFAYGGGVPSEKSQRQVDSFAARCEDVASDASPAGF